MNRYYHRPAGIALLASLLSLVSCKAPPEKARPTSSPAPLGWLEPQTSAASSALNSRWWSIFANPELAALEEQALNASPSLAKAVARVDEARAIAGIAEADRSLSVNFDPSVTRARASATDKLPPGFPIDTTRLRAALDASYEIDAWGRVKKSILAARADAASASADAATVRLTLTGDVARNYFQLQASEAELELLRRILGSREDSLAIEQSRVGAGLSNDLSVARAQLEIATTRASLESIERQTANLRHALAVLCGRTPENGITVAVVPFPILPTVPVGLPSDVLQRRPDVAAAGFALDAAYSRLGIARAAFFPQLSLTGTMGLESADLSHFIDWPSRIWSLGPSLTLPILNGGKNRANYDVASARLAQSIADYRGTILNVFREVEDALSDLQWLARQSASLEEALTSARNVAALSRERYSHGLTNYLDTVDADRSALEIERTRVQLQGQRFVSTIALAKAIGGGWTPSAPEVVAQN